MHGSIAMKESSEPDQPPLSHVWHSHDCGFNSALSDRSVGSRIFGRFRCRCLRQGGFAKCLDTSSKVSLPNSSKTGGFFFVGFLCGPPGVPRFFKKILYWDHLSPITPFF